MVFSAVQIKVVLPYFLLSFPVEHVRLGPGGAQATNIKTKPKVFVTDTRDMQLAGACVFFIKINPSKALTLANISQVTNLLFNKINK